jgi:hypothetical protein
MWRSVMRDDVVAAAAIPNRLIVVEEHVPVFYGRGEIVRVSVRFPRDDATRERDHELETLPPAHRVRTRIHSRGAAARGPPHHGAICHGRLSLHVRKRRSIEPNPRMRSGRRWLCRCYANRGQRSEGRQGEHRAVWKIQHAGAVPSRFDRRLGRRIESPQYVSNVTRHS